MLTETEQSLSVARSNTIDFDRIGSLHYLGNYVRRLPINLARMMENAHDWEHLPYVHSSSFASIDLIDSGAWGWRAKIGLPEGAPASHQLLDLIVESDRHYWVSTVYSGPGTGIEIHTQATKIEAEEIEVDVVLVWITRNSRPHGVEASRVILHQSQKLIWFAGKINALGGKIFLQPFRQFAHGADRSTKVVADGVDDIVKNVVVNGCVIS